MSENIGNEEVREQFADEQTELSAVEAFRAINTPLEEEEGAQEIEGQEQATPPEEGDAGAAQQESADEADAAVAEDDQQPPGETEQDDPDVEDDTPSIDPPRSWTDAEKEAFKALPPEHQQILSERERARDLEIRRRQDEAAQQMQAAQAREQAAEQARKSFEDQLPNLLQAIQSQYNSQFADIKSWDDVQKMASEDPIRFSQWQAVRAQEEAVQREVSAAETRQREIDQQKAREFYTEESRRFLEKAPEFADPDKGQGLWKKAFETLAHVGFSSEEINDAWNTGGAIPVHDHRFQLLVRDAMLYRNAKNTVKKAPQKTPPARNVQRPGPAPDKGQERTEHVKRLEDRLSRTGSRKDAMALLRAGRG